MTTASAGGSSALRPMVPHRIPDPGFSTDVSSSSSSRAAGPRSVPCDGGGEEDVLDLDSPWVAAAEAESRLEEAVVAAARIYLRAEDEEEEEGIRGNQERQEDELMALEAIYGDDLVELGKKRGLRCFQIYIRYDLHDGSQQMENVLMMLQKKMSYPSKDPPYFTVTVKWMDGSQVSQICEMLDTIWAELPGQEVVYQWVEWIRFLSLSHLWFDGKITLGPDNLAQKRDNRAISRGLPLNYVIPLMLSYSSKKRHQDFLEDLHMCMICLNESKRSNFIQLPCQHLFCAKCMETLCRMHVKEGSVFRLVCPDTKCNASIPPYLLKNLLKEEEFERWDRLALEKALDSMSDVVYCPRCAIGCLEDGDNNAQCPKCSFIFCSLCKDPRHPGKQCLTPEQKLQRREASGKLTAKEMLQEMLNIKMVYNDAVACPKCRMAISKTEGCNMMYCINCGQSFCFRCGKAFDREHFSKCGLYTPREEYDIKDLHKQIEELDTAHRRALRRPVGSTIKCSKCRQKILKGW